MAGPESFHFSQGPQHQKWHCLSSLQTVSSDIMHHVCSWKPHCVLLGEWEQEAKNKLAWWEWLWSCKYRESSLPTKVASFWCGKNNDVGRDLGFDEEENRPYWMLWLTCLNSWLYLWGFSFGRRWKFGDVGFIKEKWITRSRLWRLNSLLFLARVSWSFTMICSHRPLLLRIEPLCSPSLLYHDWWKCLWNQKQG